MSELVPSLNHWIHLMSAIIWIGGAAFLVMAVNPTLRRTVPPDIAAKLVGAFYKRFQRIVGVLMLIILVTGGVNLHFVRIRLGGAFDPLYLTLLFIKLSLVTLLLTVFIYSLLFWSPPTADQSAEGDESADPVHGVPFQRVAFWTGILIVLMAAMLKHRHL